MKSDFLKYKNGSSKRSLVQEQHLILWWVFGSLKILFIQLSHFSLISMRRVVSMRERCCTCSKTCSCILKKFFVSYVFTGDENRIGLSNTSAESKSLLFVHIRASVAKAISYLNFEKTKYLTSISKCCAMRYVQDFIFVCYELTAEKVLNNC